MKIVHVRYHHEDGNWWAESEDLPGWTAVGASFEEVQQMAREGVAEFAGVPVAVEEIGVPIVVTTGVQIMLNDAFQISGKISNDAAKPDLRWVRRTQGGAVPALPKSA